MPGTCVTTIKVLGVTLLGLLTSSLVFTVYDLIPRLIKEISVSGVETSTKKSSCISLRLFVPGVRISLGLLGGASSILFSLAYLYSPLYAQHPYLIYASLVSPLTFVGVYYFGNGTRYEEKVKQVVTDVVKRKNSNESVLKVKEAPAANEAQSTPSTPSGNELKAKVSEDDLGKSYIHISDAFDVTSATASVKSLDDYEAGEQDTPGEDSSEDESVSTPKVSNVEEQESVDDEIRLVLSGKELALTLGQLKDSYYIGSLISGIGFVIASVGVIGEHYFL
ncbi:uncharacterized protein KQ657_003519 [Scheffersomyces spartinae]|uniref:Autophagy-related protein 33 n=1 Tax=Scheffersomyces spartinae TaxID=45513 RepID=A0A9P7V4U9_9ASCO|nr:uncharacterized protein KQ657_003519 [Scheffersomyces spartinae]KAG7191347.1 hypothetical protein KQ657_003519 [Scheffersomyces spartinae]